MSRGPDPLLVDVDGHSELLLGNEAIVRGALEAGVGFAAGYPGTPSSEITDSFARLSSRRSGLVFEYSINEKIALEMAFAASLGGARSICAMKHLGLMVAGDPLSTIPYIGVKAGMVIVSAVDPSCLTSPNEADQRLLARMLHLPTLDPATPAEAHRLARLAFDLSEASNLPVLLKVSTRVAHTRARVHYGRLARPLVRGFERDPARLVPIPAIARRLRVEIEDRLARARTWTEGHALELPAGEHEIVIIASGAPAATSADLLDELGVTVPLVRLPVVHPLPEDLLAGLLGRVSRAVVVEELSPFLEDSLLALSARRRLGVEILGKHSGHFPVPFEYTPDVLLAGLARALDLEVPAHATAAAPDLVARPPVLCAGCPHRSSFHAAKAAFGPDQIFMNDIGCYTLGFGPPLDAADALVCMGAGFTLAAGVARTTGQRTVGFMGDSTFFHAGMPALLNAAKEKVGMVAVILDNQVTAMTGFQESPGVVPTPDGYRRDVAIEDVVRALGCDQVEVVDPNDLAATMAAYVRARDATGLSVVITRSPCVVYDQHVHPRVGPKVVFQVDLDTCQHCGRSGCGLQCDQPTTLPFERQRAKTRATRPGPVPPNAPCSQQCPLGLCILGYNGHIAAGDAAMALDLVASRNALPHSVCRVCHRPCETACIHVEPVAINDLKRFAVEHGGPWTPTLEPDHGRHVAVVGAGPAGLSAARDLRLRGYAVSLFDGRPEPGGMLRYGVPRFRLPADALQADLQGVLQLGVVFHGEHELGRNLELDALVRDHDAVFLAIGAWRARPLPLPGEGPPTLDALDYLARQPAADRVVVVGGGNAGIDVARTARRLGASSVVIVERLPTPSALADEVAHAEAEGIQLRAGASASAFDPAGLVVDGHVVPADLVVIATGQLPGDTFGLDVAPDGTIAADPRTGQTSRPGVFAGGDCASTTERTVTQAMAWGQRAAWGIDRHLRGAVAADRHMPPPRPDEWPRAPKPPSTAGRGRGRRHPPELEASRRVSGFEEVVGTLSALDARAEALRCQSCGQCGNCRACIDTFGCPAFFLSEGRIRIDADLCTGCGVCAELCPNDAIHPVEPS